MIKIYLIIEQHPENGKEHAANVRPRHGVAQNKQGHGDDEYTFAGVCNRVCQGCDVM